MTTEDVSNEDGSTDDLSTEDLNPLEISLRGLIERRSMLYDDLANEFAARQAVLDVAGEAGCNPDDPLPGEFARTFDEHTLIIRCIQQLIAVVDKRIEERSAAVVDRRIDEKLAAGGGRETSP
jgi:hypothetical protein